MDNKIARICVMRERCKLVQEMRECEKPVISAIKKAIVLIGAELASLADMSVAVRDGKILDGHTRIRAAAGSQAAVIWPSLSGVAKAKY